MLENTFSHIRGIGPKTERKLWDSDIKSWDDVSRGRASLAGRKAQLAEDCLRESKAQLANGNPDYFSRRLATSQHWRLFPHFRHATAYLDIETTGLGAPGDYITVIGLYDGKSIRHYIHDDNLLDFKDDIREYKMLVTYNGKMFDIPFIRSYLNIPLQQAHIDLRFPLASLGYRGGLKTCERKLGIEREDVAGIDGFFAVLLWHDYNNNGNEKALETLLAYNIADVVNLEKLAVLAYNMKLEETPFAKSRRLKVPPVPRVQFRAHAETVKRLRSGIGERL